MSRIKRIVLGLMAAAMMILGLSACGSSSPSNADPGYFVPQVLYPTTIIPGSAVCIWTYDIEECGNSQLPQSSWYAVPLISGYNYGYSSVLTAAILNWYLPYRPYFGSSNYYNVYVPRQFQGVHPYSSFAPRFKTFDTVHAAQEKAAYSHAQWYNPVTKKIMTGTVAPSQVGPTKGVTPAQINPPKNNGGNAGGKTGATAPRTGANGVICGSAYVINGSSTVNYRDAAFNMRPSGGGSGGSGGGSHGGSSGGGAKPPAPAPKPPAPAPKAPAASPKTGSGSGGAANNGRSGKPGC